MRAAGMIKRAVAASAMMLAAATALAAEGDVPRDLTDGSAAHEQLPSADNVPLAPAPSGTPPSALDPSLQSGAGLSACRAWSDGCVTCQRIEGRIVCSNIGIACQPQTPRCLEAEPALDKRR